MQVNIGKAPTIDLLGEHNQSDRVCVLVINWNGKEHLRKSLPTILRQEYSPYDVWVLDNASTDGSTDMVKNDFPGVLVLRNERNLGFTGAGNLGILRARAHGYAYVLVMANDVVLDPRCLSGAVAAARANPTAGMIGFNMLGAISTTPFIEYENAVKNWAGLEIEETKWVEGAAFLTSPALIERIGGYDEILFMYGDENDLETRLTLAGYRLLKTNIPVWHDTGRNVMGDQKLRAAYYVFRNTMILRTKHGSWREVLLDTLGLVRCGCDPFIKVSTDSVLGRRQRPSNILVNALVIVTALLSYGLNIRGILRVRRDHRKLIELERRVLERGQYH